MGRPPPLSCPPLLSCLSLLSRPPHHYRSPSMVVAAAAVVALCGQIAICASYHKFIFPHFHEALFTATLELRMRRGSPLVVVQNIFRSFLDFAKRTRGKTR